MRKLPALLVAAAMLFPPVFLFAQKQTITGKVTDAKSGDPLGGVSVRLKSSGKGVSTGRDGRFSLSAGPGDELEVSIIGYKSQSIAVGNQISFSIALETNLMELTEIVFVGSRGVPRIKTETPVPVDIININQVNVPTAKMDLSSVLNATAPSFNYNKQSGADGADHIDLGTLRGLGPDQSLVLINGKRRHQTAFVALFGTRGRGNSGSDLNAFPEAAVDRIEILRDGASAQYGSDAMAGVINIILKKDISHWNINAGWAGCYDKKYNAYQTRASNQYYYNKPIDGSTYSFSVNNGFALGARGGYINFSADFRTQGKTYRQVSDTNVSTHSKALPLNSGRRAFGDGSITSGGLMYNMELPVSNTGRTSFYSFGAYNYKASDAYAYTRNWSGCPDRFPVDASGNRIDVPSIMRTSIDGEVYYNPHIQTHITDVSIATGLKGLTADNWAWDLSNTLGRNDFHFYGDKTFNASIIGKPSPNHFDDGGFNFLQNTLNLDFSKSYKEIANGLVLALGAEYRYERYSIYKGEEGSYTGYPNSVGLQQAPGSQGFPGFSPADEVKADRSVVAMYADIQLDVTRRWLIDMAVRFENYSDFGYVNTSKLATRYKLGEYFNLRGSISTGYRAPSLQQINFSNTLTSFSGGTLVQSRIANNNDPITRAAGIPNLKQETSLNTSLGFSWKPTSNFTVTLDGYLIKVKDRIVLSGLFLASDTTLPVAVTSQLQNLNVATAQFFDNAVNTTNYGLDIVLDYNKRFGRNTLKAQLLGNLQHMKIDAVNAPSPLNDSYFHRKTFFSDREEAFLKASAPKAKFSLTLDYSSGGWGVGTHLNYFGKVVLMGYGWTGAYAGSGINPQVPSDRDPNVNLPEVFNYGGKVTTDVYASYKFSKKVSLFIGADNLFNVHPDFGVNPQARYSPFDNESGGPWDSVQMGFNGLRLFSKLVLNL
ncbi:MAG: TonB-dependent receptor [Bacteroidetes bacterium]|nr:TonB-dependent receptor [Bacteroidota bacterium]